MRADQGWRARLAEGEGLALQGSQRYADHQLIEGADLSARSLGLQAAAVGSVFTKLDMSG